MAHGDRVDGSGVHPATQVGANGHITHQLPRHSLHKCGVQPLDEFISGHARRLIARGVIPVACDPWPGFASGIYREDAAGRQEPHPFKERQISKYILKRKILVERFIANGRRDLRVF